MEPTWPVPPMGQDLWGERMFIVSVEIRKQREAKAETYKLTN